jgi:hypothetical protein
MALAIAWNNDNLQIQGALMLEEFTNQGDSPVCVRFEL